MIGLCCEAGLFLLKGVGLVVGCCAFRQKMESACPHFEKVTEFSTGTSLLGDIMFFFCGDICSVCFGVIPVSTGQPVSTVLLVMEPGLLLYKVVLSLCFGSIFFVLW